MERLKELEMEAKNLAVYEKDLLAKHKAVAASKDIGEEEKAQKLQKIEQEIQEIKQRNELLQQKIAEERVRMEKQKTKIKER
jgi:hypothetical protein